MYVGDFCRGFIQCLNRHVHQAGNIWFKAISKYCGPIHLDLLVCWPTGTSPYCPDGHPASVHEVSYMRSEICPLSQYSLCQSLDGQVFLTSFKVVWGVSHPPWSWLWGVSIWSFRHKEAWRDWGIWQSTCIQIYSKEDIQESSEQTLSLTLLA